jgi:hypothetical protein
LNELLSNDQFGYLCLGLSVGFLVTSWIILFFKS